MITDKQQQSRLQYIGEILNNPPNEKPVEQNYLYNPYTDYVLKIRNVSELEPSAPQDGGLQQPGKFLGTAYALLSGTNKAVSLAPAVLVSPRFVLTNKFLFHKLDLQKQKFTLVVKIRGQTWEVDDHTYQSVPAGDLQDPVILQLRNPPPLSYGHLGVKPRIQPKKNVCLSVQNMLQDQTQALSFNYRFFLSDMYLVKFSVEREGITYETQIPEILLSVIKPETTVDINPRTLRSMKDIGLDVIKSMGHFSMRSIQIQSSIVLCQAYSVRKAILSEKHFQMLGTLRIPSLKKFYLAQNQMTETSFNSFLHTTFDVMESLTLSNQPIKTSSFPFYFRTLQTDQLASISTHSERSSMAKAEDRQYLYLSPFLDALSKQQTDKVNSEQNFKVTDQGFTQMLQTDQYSHFDSFYFSNIQLSNPESLRYLFKWKDLKVLELASTTSQEGDAFLKVLAIHDWRNLTKLGLSSLGITNKGVKSLSAQEWPSLQYLDLRGNRFGAPGIKVLMKMSFDNLKVLDLCHNNSCKSEDCFDMLVNKRSWKKLKYLSMGSIQFKCVTIQHFFAKIAKNGLKCIPKATPQQEDFRLYAERLWPDSEGTHSQADRQDGYEGYGGGDRDSDQGQPRRRGVIDEEGVEGGEGEGEGEEEGGEEGEVNEDAEQRGEIEGEQAQEEAEEANQSQAEQQEQVAEQERQEHPQEQDDYGYSQNGGWNGHKWLRGAKKDQEWIGSEYELMMPKIPGLEFRFFEDPLLSAETQMAGNFRGCGD